MRLTNSMKYLSFHCRESRNLFANFPGTPWNGMDDNTTLIPCNVTMAHAVDCCLFPTGSVEDRSDGPGVLSHYHIPKKRLGGNRDHFPGSISNTLAANQNLNTPCVDKKLPNVWTCFRYFCQCFMFVLSILWKLEVTEGEYPMK